MRKALVFIVLMGLLALGGPAAPVAAAVGQVADGDDVPNNAGDISSALVNHDTTVTVGVTVSAPEDPSTSANWRGNPDTFADWFIDTDLDGVEDFEVTFGSTGAGALDSNVEDLNSNTQACAGTPGFANGAYTVQFPRTCVGSPASIAFNVFVSYDTTPANTTDNPQTDEAPDGGGFSSPVAGPSGGAIPDRPVRSGVVGQGDNQLWVGHGFGALYDAMGGGLSAAPAIGRIAQADASADAVPVFVATGTDHQLWIRRPSEVWRPLSDGGTYCIDSPGAVVYDNDPGAPLDQRLVVACQGSDHALWMSINAIDANTTPKLNAWTRIGGFLTAGPSVSVAEGVVTYLVAGVGGHIWESKGAGTPFTSRPWTCIGHPAFGTLNNTAWFGCHGTDNGLWAAKNGGSGWGNAFSLGGALVDGPGVAVTPTQAVFFVQGTDNGVWQRVVQNSDGAPLTNFTSDGGRIKFGVNATSL